MPRVIAPGAGDAITLDELVDALEAERWDPRDEDAFAALGPWLARLGRNRDFLADLAIAELEQRFAGQEGNSYGAQVLMLRPPGTRYALRANFWPARDDAVVKAGGTAPFFYDLPHDHNFSFLTLGYLGPGYWSDYYLFDGAVAGLPGERARLVFDRRARLEPGKLMLYRAHHDVHVQLPPDSFSVSLNVLGYERGQPWRTQYRFDTAADTITQAMTTTPSEALVTLATRLGGEAGTALVADLSRRHPHPRLRATALAALRGALSPHELYATSERALGDGHPLVAATARATIAALQDRSVPDPPPPTAT
ncbi:MAG: transposase [Sphingomonas taxi]|uniref:Transposase n=1 Tax=Sphingomonas taxi TaxID=1549858 RepID=A0A2W5P5W5_9SPHN|nr:MAG: transposase [Sphingomonas taxi]